MTKLTLLNSMAAADFATALDQHLEWKLEYLDLKDSIFGKGITELTDAEVDCAAEMIRVHGLTVYCLSSTIFHPAIELGEAYFRETQLGQLDRLIAIARVLQPRMVRLLGAQLDARATVTDSVAHLEAHYPWVMPLYAEAIDRLYDAGFHTTIENECDRCIFATPEEVLGFFARLDRPERVSFTWDVQNLWEVGTFPTLDAYRKLKPLIAYYHLKGGQIDGTSTTLRWSTALEDASWPVLEITRQVVADGVSPVICLNSSHGSAKPGYDYRDVTKRDIDFLRRNIPEVA